MEVVLGILVYSLFVHQTSFVLCLDSSKAYIVYMGDTQHSGVGNAQESHHKILADVLGSHEAAKESILYSYKHGFSGFSAILSQSQAELIADLPGVARVIPNRIFSLHTTRSWDFLHVNPQMADDGLLSKSHSGAGCIIGVLDTGIWPESDSFKEDGIGEVPSRWNGICQEGEKFKKAICNRKIIGARWYISGYEAEFGKLNTTDGLEFRSPRDAVGHGTHTSSTAAGALLNDISFMGLARGLARGGAPAAHIAVYKICWSTGGCSSADLLKAFDDAIVDGVDVLSVSLGSTPPFPSYVDDPLAIGSFHAVAKGITVVCSAGNSGPFPETVANTAPWLITVGASTIDRAFPTAVTLGNNQTLAGQALYTGKNVDKFYHIVYGEDIMSPGSDEDSARSCDIGSLDAAKANGKVVLCFQSRSQRSATIALQTVEAVNGSGLIFARFPSKDIELSTTIPCVQVDFTIGTSILSYMEAQVRAPLVKFSISQTIIGQQISPEIAIFSSRGPSSLSPSVLKPDIVAPGVNILAAWSPASSIAQAEPNGEPSLKFKIESGTSMSCPHVSGIVALQRAVHPGWSPAMIRSALITTASIEDNYGQRTVAEGAPHKQADIFDYGGGHVNPNRAMNPGLVFNTENLEYLCFICSMGYNNSAISSMVGNSTRCPQHSNCLENLNQPSIVIPNLKQHLTVTREATNVGPRGSIYFVKVEAPPGVYVKVKPPVLVFKSTMEKQKFRVSFHSLVRVQGRYSFGKLMWDDGVHRVRMPMAVRSVIDDFCAQT
ncbi:hypothetical protein SAY87_006115 [Trapa incisa]|uniref:Uncharacterized protein n=1 Tax=Trapa incisa TaxID=236973 RepID=A0AAN7Q866_9MYRT|nr:hypothetical protein SAY87_006115 [Trapa incisa]